MIHTLPVVEIPGFPDALRKERALRDAAWLDGTQNLCEVEISPLCLRRLIWMEQARCGFVVNWRFDTDDELVSHAILFLWMMRVAYRPPTTTKFSFLRTFWTAMRQHRFASSNLRRLDHFTMIKDIRSYLDDCYMDAPTGSDSVQSYASYPAYVMDLFGAAGFTYTEEQVMVMPLPRLWQLWRVATQRLYNTKLTNPSDDLATKVIAAR